MTQDAGNVATLPLSGVWFASFRMFPLLGGIQRKLILTHIICLNPNSFTGSFTISLAGKTQIPEHLQGRDFLQDLKRHFRYGSMAHAEEVW
jgi:hypothetical protein